MVFDHRIARDSARFAQRHLHGCRNDGMPTLQELTLEHSRRLSEVYRTRDVRLAEAQASRDLRLRALPAAVKAFQRYDDELASAREKHLATQGKAEAARSSALLAAADHRAGRFQDAQLARRATDVEGVQGKRRIEDAAEVTYRLALDHARAANGNRSRVLQEADRARRLALDEAKRTHDETLSTSQRTYRAAVEDAVKAERRDNRDSERAYYDALRLGDAALNSARASADQTLLASLSVLAEARDILRAWYQQVAAIKTETAKAEQDEFSRFRREMDEVRV
jgi:hypothetical protein